MRARASPIFNMTGRSKRPDAALGFRAHSGWACAILAAGDRNKITIVARRRITLCDPRIEGSKQPFHEAEPMSFEDARAYIARCTKSTERLARDSFATLQAEAEAAGFRIAGVCQMTASPRALPDLRAILASHALIHAAEGEFYREALARAAETAKLAAGRIREKDAPTWTASQLGISEAALRERLSALGKALGPPWGADEKLATMAAWAVLAG